LAILVAAGQTAPVKAPIAVIGQPGETVADAGPPPAAAAPGPAPVAASAAARGDGDGGEWIKASPAARRLAKDQGIDLRQVTGSGPEGRVVERDVLRHASANRPRATPLAAKMAVEHGIDLASLASGGRITSQQVMAAAQVQSEEAPAVVSQTLPASANEGTPLAGMRRVIAERMSASWTTAPHVTLTVEVDMSEAMGLKRRLSEATDSKISFTEIIARCTAAALAEFPMVNASLIDGRLVRHDEIHLGVAVALEDGLIVPVVRNAAGKSVTRLGAEIRQLTDKARQGRLGPDEVSGGTFTITNLGMYGVDQFTPIINQPESAILGVCRVVERPVVCQGKVEIRPLMNLCLSFDHRIIDGAVAARFMARLRQLIEQPVLLV
jgi:pyruvate dehydrogenase E2 component (dihydrolipoamide acetyltransferase)